MSGDVQVILASASNPRIGTPLKSGANTGAALVETAAGVDSLGNALDAGFDNLAVAITPSANGPTAFTVVAASGTYVQTLTYNGSGQLTNISAWVKQ